MAALGVDHLTVQHLIVGVARLVGAHIHHGGNLDAFGVQVGSGAVAVVIVGENRHAPVGGDGKAVGIGAQGRGEHNAGTVVVLERDGTLDRTGGQHRAAGVDTP